MKHLYMLVLIVAVVASCGKVAGDHLPSVTTQLRSFRIALRTFHEDCGRYPSSAEGLAALITRPSDLPEGRWKGPYLDGDSIPSDRWGHPYAYYCPSTSTTNAYDLYSCGPDGVSKSQGSDPDDINVWDLKPRPNP